MSILAYLLAAPLLAALTYGLLALFLAEPEHRTHVPPPQAPEGDAHSPEAQAYHRRSGWGV